MVSIRFRANMERVFYAALAARQSLLLGIRPTTIGENSWILQYPDAICLYPVYISVLSLCIRLGSGLTLEFQEYCLGY